MQFICTRLETCSTLVNVFASFTEKANKLYFHRQCMNLQVEKSKTTAKLYEKGKKEAPFSAFY